MAKEAMEGYSYGSVIDQVWLYPCPSLRKGEKMPQSRCPAGTQMRYVFMGAVAKAFKSTS
jgi:hypothetical protein